MIIFFQSIIFYTNWGRIKRHTASISHLRGDCYGFKHNLHFISDIDLLSKLGNGGRASFARITRQAFGVSRTLVNICKGNWSEISQRRATHLRSGEWKPNSACKVQDKEGGGGGVKVQYEHFSQTGLDQKVGNQCVQDRSDVQFVFGQTLWFGNVQIKPAVTVLIVLFNALHDTLVHTKHSHYCIQVL